MGTEFLVTVDLVMLTVRRAELCALLIRRGSEPFKGGWALPGGFVEPEEDLPAAAERELAEETGLRHPAAHLEQLGAYGAPDRDPRGRVVTVAYLALLPEPPAPVAGTDAAAAALVPLSALRPDELAFDHAQILADGVERARARLERTPVATAFCPAEFTMAELREVYEAVWERRLDPGDFHRQAAGIPGFVTGIDRSPAGEGADPTQLIRRGDAALLHPPLLRSGMADPAAGT